MHPKFTQRPAAAAALERYFESPANYANAGRRAIAMEACFGRPWPTVAERQRTDA